MQDVHYFQRFSRKEDVVTNNTLLLFSRLQHHDAQLFQQILRVLISDDKLVVGASLTEQEKATSKKIADGVIGQQGFHVVLETKLHASFDVDQLKGHLSAFESSKEDMQVLLLLGTQEAVRLSSAQQAVTDFNSQHGRSVRLESTTFAKVVETCRDVVPEHERAVVEMLEDYEAFCEDEGILLTSDADLLVVGCSQTLEDNRELRLYYDPKASHRPAKYIGFYEGKAVRAIGELAKVVRVDRLKNGLQTIEGPDLTAEEQARIERAMDGAPAHGWDITHGYWFFLANGVEETLFRKETKYPLWNRRYFDLREALELPEGKLPELSILAQRLRGKTW